MDYGRDFKTIRTSFGRLLTTLNTPELSEVPLSHKIRRIVSGDGAIILLTYDYKAFVYANSDFSEVPLDRVEFIAMAGGIGVVATTSTVYTY